MKKWLKNIFDFYLDASIHVALASSSLVLLTYFFAQTPVDFFLLSLVFFGTIFSYNFIKYFSLFTNKRKLLFKDKAILFFSVFSLILLVISFLFLSLKAIITTFVFGLLCLLYAIPVGKDRPNLRNVSGIKIYIVALCWAGVTLLLPLYQAGFEPSTDMFLKFFQRFLLVLILILIFEINDLKYDDIQLKTVPQSIGMKNTKLLIYSLLIPFFCLEFGKEIMYSFQWQINLFLVVLMALFTYFVTSEKNKYYTHFWVESVPIIWYLLTIFIDHLV